MRVHLRPSAPAPARRQAARGWADERGAAVAESTMVMALIVLLFATLVQAGLVIHVRNVMIDAASAGARYGALADRTPDDGVRRTRELLATSIPGQGGVAVAAETGNEAGLPILKVTVEGSLPAVGFLPGPMKVKVSGHAYRY